MVPSLRGSLLIAGPGLLDPNFRRTVVLLTEHDEDGAMGIVLNRPAEATVVEAAPELEPLVEADDPLFVGGPVRPDAVLVLAEFDDPAAAGILSFEDVGLLGADTGIDGAPSVTRRARVFAGHAGWGAGQLESELERSDWIVEPAARELVFSDAPERLWPEILTRKGGQYAIVARMPPDPSVN